MAGSAIRTSLFVLPPLRCSTRVGGLVLGAVAGRRDRLGAGRRRAPRARPGASCARRCSARGSSARSTSACRRRACSTRSRASIRSSAIRGPEASVAPPDPALLNEPGRPLRAHERLPGHRHGLRARRLRLGLGRGAEPRRHERARRRRDEGPARRPQRRRLPRRRRRRLRRPRRHRGAARRRARSAAARARSTPSAGQAVAILGYPENGPFTAAAGRIGQTSDVLTDDAYGRGPRQRADHDAARRRPPRQLGRARGRRPRARADDGLRLAHRRRQPGYGVPTRARPRRSSADARDSGSVSTGPCVALEHVEDPERAAGTAPRGRRPPPSPAPPRSARAPARLPTSARVRRRPRAAAPAPAPGRRSRAPRCGSAPPAAGSASARRRRAAGSASGRRSGRGTRRGSARSKRIWVIANWAPASSLRSKRSQLEIEVVGGRVDGDADEERGRGVDAAAVVVLAAVQAR